MNASSVSSRARPRRVRRCASLLAVASLALLALWGPGARRAEARVPAHGDMPTLDELYRQARQEKIDAEKRAADAARDPLAEAIEAYKSGATPLEQFSALTDIINNAKDEDVQPYRSPAAEALLQRFLTEDVTTSATAKRVRAAVGLEIVDLMKSSSSDTLGLAIVHRVLSTWWKYKLEGELKFKPDDKPRDRQKAWKRMQAYLKSGEKD